jgi:hypothetical protein
MPLLKTLLNQMGTRESAVLSSILDFNAQARPTCDDLIKFSFFRTAVTTEQSLFAGNTD